MGYKQFANRLFIKNPKYDAVHEVTNASSASSMSSLSISSDVDGVAIATVRPTQAKTKIINITAMNEAEIKEAIDSGKIIVNPEIISLVRNSLIVCDEIHKVYNSEVKNNWGIALNTVLNIPNLGFRVIFLSATPINNNPAEFVDLLNMLLPPPYNTVKRDDLFIGPSYHRLKPGALQLIGKLTAGRISFLQDQDPRYYPKRIIHGKQIPGVGLLKFIRCPMSKIHFDTYKTVYNGAIQQDSQNLIDFVLPDPTEPGKGMFQTSQITTKLSTASPEWKEKNGIDIQDNIIVGSILDASNIGKWSTKYMKLLELLQTFLLEPKSGKIFIYHDAVYISGVLFIQELLKRNGYLDEHSSSNDDTLCTICGKVRELHDHIDEEKDNINTDIIMENEDMQLSNLVRVIDDMIDPITGGVGGQRRRIKDHAFIPVRFIIAHSDIEKGYLNRNIERFNHPDNLYGDQIRIIIGSQLMKESYDLKAGRKCIVMRRPENIPGLIQIMGRLFRNYSHKGLPADKWTVEYYLFTSCCPDGSMGYEEEMYKRKIDQYETIRQILRMTHIYAVDSALNYGKISKIFGTGDTVGLDILPYKPAITFNPERIKSIDLSTYSILYADSEVDMIVGFIKRAFIEWSPVWRFEDLWKFISNDKSPISVDIQIRVSMLSKEYFAAALTRLVKRKRYSHGSNTTNQDIIDNINNPYAKTIYYPTLWGGGSGVIKMIGDFYILCPDGVEDPDLIYRHSSITPRVDKISLSEFNEMQVSMDDEWQEFITEHSEKRIEQMESILCAYSLEFHEYIIKRIIGIINKQMIIGPTTSIPYWEISFYVRLLMAYDIMGIIIWASQDDHFNERYKEWITPSCGFSDTRVCSSLDVKMEKEAKGKSCSWCPGNILSLYYSKMKHIMKIVAVKGFISKKNSNNGERKIDASLYPVGYCLKRGFLYKPDSNTWAEYSLPSFKVTENDLIIGYDERVEDELVVRFKLRNPMQRIVKYKDVRKLEKGTACSSKSKEFLIEIADKIGLGAGDKNNVQSLCSSIRAQLIYNEILERQKPIGSRKRWFYYVYENGAGIY
jgi:hypothetical protein